MSTIQYFYFLNSLLDYPSHGGLLKPKLELSLKAVYGNCKRWDLNLNSQVSYRYCPVALEIGIK
jgi:hypothetical protein